MKSRLAARPRFVSLVVVLVSMAGATPSARANATAAAVTQRVGEYVHYKMFGDYNSLYLITGKTTPRYVDGKLVAPHEGMFSSGMRGMARKIHGPEKLRNRDPGPPVNYTRFEALNLAVAVPQQGWVRLDPEEQGTRNCLMLTRSEPEIIVSLAAQAVGVGAKETNGTLLNASQKKMKNIPGGEVLPGVWKLSAPGIAGRAYRAKAEFENGKQLHYSIWVATKNGFNYSLVVYGDQRDERAVDQTMHHFVGRLRQVQPDRVAHVITRPAKRR